MINNNGIIKAWCDADKEDKDEFLKWMKRRFGKSLVLYLHLLEEKEDSVDWKE